MDIQVDLATTAGSFDAMAVQIETAGAMADTAAGQTNALATATETAAVKRPHWERRRQWPECRRVRPRLPPINWQRRQDLRPRPLTRPKSPLTYGLRPARENEAAARPLTTQLGALSDEMDEAYSATDSLGVIIGRTVPQVSALTMRYIAQNKAAVPLSKTMGILSDEMDEAYTATE